MQTFLTLCTVLSIFSAVHCVPINDSFVTTSNATSDQLLEIPVSGTPQSENDTLEFDFVNLPGYGVIDDDTTELNSTFSCYEKRYGYYADIIKNCSMFHLCYPIREPSNQEIIYQRFSFVCSDDAVFDQQQLVCVDNATTPVNCEDSANHFEASNDRLLETLQQTRPGMFSIEEEDESYPGNATSVEDRPSINNNNNGPDSPTLYSLYNTWYR